MHCCSVHLPMSCLLLLDPKLRFICKLFMLFQAKGLLLPIGMRNNRFSVSWLPFYFFLFFLLLQSLGVHIIFLFLFSLLGLGAVRSTPK